MSWLFLAIIGHLANAVAFIIDKMLLSTSFKRSATYAALIGTLSVVMVVAVPWVKEWPSIQALPSVIAFGALFPLALWAFFEALRRAEASRVVPVVGSLIPLFTFAGAVLWLGERLSVTQMLGMALLLVATGLLTSGGKGGKLDVATIKVAVLSALLFAAASLAGKVAFGQASFLGVFVASRLFAAGTGVLIAFADAEAWKELHKMFFGAKREAKHAQAGWLAVVGQVAGAIGFFLVNAALAQGSAAIVNALQAVQYAAIVLVAWFGGKALRTALKEEKTPHVMLVKGAAILLVACGLALVSMTGNP